MPSFAKDANTVSLYKFNETAAGSHGSIADTAANGTGRHLTCATGANKPDITNAKNWNGEAKRYARSFSSSKRATRAGDAGALSLFIGDHTIEGIILLKNTSAFQNLYGYGGDGSSSAQNRISCLCFSAGGRVRQFWEFSSGNNESVVTSTIPTAPLDTWAYYACIVDRTAKTVKFGIRRQGDSVITWETVGYTNNPTGGGSASFEMGRLPATGTDPARADVSSLRVSVGKRSEASCFTQSEKLFTTMKLDDDSDTRILHQFGETPDAIDECDAGNHLIAVGNVLHGVPPLLPGSDDYAKYFNGSGLCELVGPWGPASKLLNTLFKTENCIEFFFRVGDNNGVTRGLATFGDPGPEDEPNNFFGWELYDTPARSIRALCEHLAGDQSGASFIVPSVFTPESYVGWHVLACNAQISGGNLILSLYLDGVHIGTSGPLIPYTGGELGVFRIGRGPAEANSFYGVIDCVRVSDRIRTVAELEDAFQDVQQGEPPVITYLL